MAGYGKGKAEGRQLLGKGLISLWGRQSYEKGLGLMLPEDLGLERACLRFFMTFEEVGAQSIPSGMRSDCSHDIQSAVRMGGSFSKKCDQLAVPDHVL